MNRLRTEFFEATFLFSVRTSQVPKALSPPPSLSFSLSLSTSLQTQWAYNKGNHFQPEKITSLNLFFTNKWKSA